jgi:hypothetical protein
MRHLFLIEDAFPARHISDQLRDDFSPIGLAARDHFFRAGMSATGRARIMRIERLIADKTIRPVAP